MTTKQETEQANIFMWKWLRRIFVIALLGTALLIWWGETHHGYAVKVPGGIEIYP